MFYFRESVVKKEVLKTLLNEGYKKESNMSKKFYTSDLHIGHKVILNECATVEVPEICKRLHDDGYVGL